MAASRDLEAWRPSCPSPSIGLQDIECAMRDAFFTGLQPNPQTPLEAEADLKNPFIQDLHESLSAIMSSGADINPIDAVEAVLERIFSSIELPTTENPCEHSTPANPLPGYDDLEADMLEDFFESKFGRATEDSADEHSEQENPTTINETEWQARLRQGEEALKRLFEQPQDNDDRVDLARMKAFERQQESFGENIHGIFSMLWSLFPFMLRKAPIMLHLLLVLMGDKPAAPDFMANLQDLAHVAVMMEDIREENPHIKQFHFESPGPFDPELLSYFVLQLFMNGCGFKPPSTTP